MTGIGVWAEQIAQLFQVSLVRSGIAARERPRLSTAAFRLPPDNDSQLNLAFCVVARSIGESITRTNMSSPAGPRVGSASVCG